MVYICLKEFPLPSWPMLLSLGDDEAGVETANIFQSADIELQNNGERES